MVSYTVLSALLVALVSSVVQADTNTNTCLALLGALNANCPQSSLIPSQSCCIAVSNFNKAGCFCNPTMSTLAGASNLALIQDVVKPVCLVLSVNPLWWWSNIINKVNWGKVDCTPFKTFTYNGGTCSSNDMQLDNARISASIGISTTIQSYVAQPASQCFNYQQFLSDLSVFLDPAPVVTVGYGVGSYTDLASAAEYLALVSPKVNKNFWLFQAPPSTSDPNAVLAVIPGGSTIILGATGGGSWFNNCTVSASGYMEQNIIFEGCNTVIKNYFVPGTSVVTGQPTNLHNFVTKFYLAAQDTDTWGIQNICNYHETYCTGTNKQFVSFSECLRFMNALPAISPTCGNGLIMSGNSSTCRFKHAFMAPLDPGAHCFHIGYGDRADKNGHFKCNDQLECTPSNPSISDPNALSLVSSPADTACTSRDESTYTTWQAPSGICSSSIAGRRVLREAN